MHRPALAALCWGYALAIGLWLAARQLYGDAIWWLALIGSAGIFLFLPLALPPRRPPI